MGILANDEDQLTYIYSSKTKNGEQILGYVESLEQDVRTIDIANQDIGHAVWADIADKVGVTLGELFSPEHPDAPDVGRAEDFDTDDWLKLIGHNPELLQNPIGIQGERAKTFASRADVLEFYGVDSAGLEKTFHTEPPTTQSQTGDENFVPPNDRDGRELR